MLCFPLPPHFSWPYLGCNFILILIQFMVKSSCSLPVGRSTKAIPDAVCSRNAVAARESLAQQWMFTIEYLFKLYIFLSERWLEGPLTPRKKSRNKIHLDWKKQRLESDLHIKQKKALWFLFWHTFLLICKKTQAKGKNPTAFVPVH